jgi:hypothetical protein
MSLALIEVSRPKRKPFRFEDMWRTNPSYEQAITTAWLPKNRGSPMNQVQEKIQRCSKGLMKWSRAHFKSITTQLKAKRDQLHRVEQKSMNGYEHAPVISLRREVNELLVKEEKMWQQRSCTLWLTKGDRNTKYFHSRATHRHRRNSLLGLRDDSGELITDHD